MLRILRNGALSVLTLVIALMITPLSVRASYCNDPISDCKAELSVAVFALQVAAGLREPPQPEDVSLTDVNGDGHIDLNDAITVLQILVGIPPSSNNIVVNTGDIFALVVDPNENPVFFAKVGDSAVTDQQGMAMGTVSATGNSSWIKVTASGYAPNYTRQIGISINERKLFETTLTPLNLSWNYLPDQNNPLIVNNPDTPSIEILAGPGVFPLGTILHMAMLEPITIGPRYAPLSGGQSGYLQIAFYFEAVDESGAIMALNDNKTLPVTIRDNGTVGNTPVLAYFDDIAGTWQVIEGAIVRADENYIQMTLPHLSLFGVFGPTQMDNGNDPYKEALGVLLNKEAANQEQALADLAASARDYAQGHRNEFGKHRLIISAGVAFEQGQTDLGNSLMEEAKSIVREMAARLLNEDECPKVRETLRVHEQVMLLGVMEYDAPLYAKLQEYYKKCNPWSGTVKYTFFFNDTWPELDDEQMKYNSGDRSWVETHDITFSVHPENHSISGESNVKVSFPKVIYKNDEDSTPACGDDYVNLGAWSEPCPGNLWLQFEGMYVNGVFTISTPAVKTTVSDIPITIYHLYQVRQWGEDEGKCAILLNIDQTIPMIPRYESLLISGFGKQTPPTLQDMLNEGNKVEIGEYEVINGAKVISPDVQGNLGRFPFTRCIVSWKIAHLKYEIK